MWVSLPTESLIWKPMLFNSLQKACTLSAGACCFKTMIMMCSPIYYNREFFSMTVF